MKSIIQLFVESYVPMLTYTRMEGFIEEEEISEDRDQSTPTPGKSTLRVSAENPNIVVTSMTPQENDMSIGTVLTSDGGTLSTLLKDLDPTKFREVDPRYLAPEILIEENIFRSFEPFKMADMYSFGLVMWEILSRTKTENFDASPFEESMPYWEHVPRDPSFMEMKKVVV
ncbi:unnamed protein product, partial [Mesorhabditis belari]|uniref:receptor protein serine/threonine kinase n=1 Tax=Mesorhabditis belari TaxID=2138241 RepID=A0AAF3FNE4_9BILA